MKKIGITIDPPILCTREGYKGILRAIVGVIPAILLPDSSSTTRSHCLFQGRVDVTAKELPPLASRDHGVCEQQIGPPTSSFSKASHPAS